MRSKKPFMSMLALLATLSLVAAACGDDSDDAGSSGASESTEQSSDDSAADDPMTDDSMDDGDEAVAEPVGEACAAIPDDGPGSSAGMAADPAATAASNNELLTTLVSAVGVAELGDALNDTSAEYTIFAPVNDAFAALPEGTVEGLTTDPEQRDDLENILLFHVVEGKMSIDELIEAGEVTALNGGTSTIEASGDTFTINGEAMVLCGNVATANATVHLIDSVLLPES